MPDKTAKLFVNGGSQAVRLPVEFRFDGADEVYIRRDAVSGEVILSARAPSHGWRDFFALRDAAAGVADTALERPLNLPLKPRPLARNPAPRAAGAKGRTPTPKPALPPALQATKTPIRTRGR